MSVVSILICTLNDRIESVPAMLLRERSDVQYVVSFQYTDDMFLDMIPSMLQEREDVTILLYPSTGLSANRNNSLRHCATPLAIISDDDTRYTDESIDRVLATFERDESLDILHFSDGRIACRMTAQLPSFDTRFGLGSEYLSCGEEEVFLHQAKTYGQRILHMNEPLDASNPYLGPWLRFGSDKRVRRSWGALQYMKHSTLRAALRIVNKALREGYGWRGRWEYLRDLYDGLHYIIRHPLNESVADEVPIDFQPLDIYKLANV